MAFSKGKRIEDETSKHIVDIAVNIGCNEGTEALTVTRLCRELKCDRRVIYNRFRDITEINMLVADRCNDEIIINVRNAVDEETAFDDKLITVIKSIFNYIYEKNSYFQYYTTLYRISDNSIKNEILQYLTDLIEKGKEDGKVKPDTDCNKAAENIWLILTGISGILAANSNYKYQEGLNTIMYGVKAIISYMLP